MNPQGSKFVPNMVKANMCEVHTSQAAAPDQCFTAVALKPV